MFLVADVGSTKADWTFYSPEIGAHEVAGIGVNPNLHTDAEMHTVLSSVCPEHIPQGKVLWVHYYGTGIWDAGRAQRLQTILHANFPSAEIFVHHDLLGAARAACGDAAGVACILGTGSNSCLYDGVRVTDNVTNLGWLLGDEGSGVDLGKRLIRAYSYRELTPEVRELFEESTGYNRQSIGDALYGPGNPNRFLASFSPFVHDNLEHQCVRSLVVDSVTEFVRRHVLKYAAAKELPISFIGSIAYHYQDIVREVCTAHGLACGNIAKKPIEALTTYHREVHYPV